LPQEILVEPVLKGQPLVVLVSGLDQTFL